MAPDNDVFSFIKDWLWAPALGLIAWAWNRNEREHDMLRERTESIKQNTSDGYSTLNNRVMEYVDSKVGVVQAGSVNKPWVATGSGTFTGLSPADLAAIRAAVRAELHAELTAIFQIQTKVDAAL